MFRLVRLTLALCLLVPLTLQAQDVSKLKFEKYTSAQGKYTANFPGKVQQQKKSAPTEAGDIQIHLDIVAIGNDLAFIISFNDYPEAIKAANPENVLAGVRDGNKGADGEIVSDEAIKFGPEKLAGRKVTIKKPGELYLKTLMVLKGARLYQVMVVGKKEQINSKGVEDFHKSFQITK